MARDEDAERPVTRPGHVLGEPLDRLSVGELRMRIETLHREIARLENEVVAKQASRGAADAVFKR